MADLQHVIRYQAAMSQAKTMLDRGIISREDLITAEGIFARKYGINSGSLYRDIDLINLAFRANMSPIKEVT